MIGEFLILNTSGVSPFNWTPEGTEADFGLISGFLSAFHVFAKTERGKEIKKFFLKRGEEKLAEFKLSKIDPSFYDEKILDWKAEKALLKCLLEVHPEIYILNVLSNIQVKIKKVKTHE